MEREVMRKWKLFLGKTSLHQRKSSKIKIRSLKRSRMLNPKEYEKSLVFSWQSIQGFLLLFVLRHAKDGKDYKRSIFLESADGLWSCTCRLWTHTTLRRIGEERIYK